MFNLENHVADYKTQWVTCDECHGDGSLIIDDRKELVKVLMKYRCSFAEILYIFRTQYLHDGFIECPCCGGKGGEEKWF